MGIGIYSVKRVTCCKVTSSPQETDISRVGRPVALLFGFPVPKHNLVVPSRTGGKVLDNQHEPVM